MVVVIVQFWYFLSYTVLVFCVENFLHLLPEAFLPFEDCPRKRQSSVDFASNMCGEKVMHWKYKILHAVHGKHAGSELLLCHHIWHDICLACSASYGTTLQIQTRNASRNCRAVDLHSRSLLIYTSIEERRRFGSWKLSWRNWTFAICRDCLKTALEEDVGQVFHVVQGVIIHHLNTDQILRRTFIITTNYWPVSNYPYRYGLLLPFLFERKQVQQEGTISATCPSIRSCCHFYVPSRETARV